MEKKQNCYASVFFIVASTVGILYTRTMSRSAAKYPLFLLWLILGFSIVLLLKSVIVLKKEKKSINTDNTSNSEKKLFTLKEFGVILIAIVYVVLLKLFGFVPASAVAFAGLAVYMGYRKWVPLVIITTVSILVIYFIFFKYLNLSYIRGIWF